MDFESLRNDLINYVGSAAFVINPALYLEVCEIENASNEELINIAINNDFNLDDYKIDIEYIKKLKY